VFNHGTIAAIICEAHVRRSALPGASTLFICCKAEQSKQKYTMFNKILIANRGEIACHGSHRPSQAIKPRHLMLTLPLNTWSVR
jgi:hypothetical protein